MQRTVSKTERIPGLESYLDKASAIELARRSLLGGPVYTIISLIMLAGTPMLRSYGNWAFSEVALLVMLGGIRVWFALGFERRYEKSGEKAVIQFNILTAIQSLTLGVMAAMVIWQYWAVQEVMLTIALSAGCVAAGTSALSVRHSAQIIFMACVLVPFGLAVWFVGGPIKAMLIIGFLMLMAFLVQDGGQARSAYFRHLKDGYTEMINHRRLAVESQARNEFMRNIGHELRTPVNSIIGMAALLLDETLSPRSREYATNIRKSSSHLLGLIGSVPGAIRTDLHISEDIPGAKNLHESIQDVINMYAVAASGKGLELKSQLNNFPEDLMSTDSGQLEQVLANLLANAISYTQKGSVILTSSCDFRDNGTALIEFSVIDTGIGMSAENLATIFDPFTQSVAKSSGKFGGSGLGLPLCKGLVDLMGGDISIESAEGEGTTVNFSISVELDPSFDTDLLVKGDDNLQASENNVSRYLSDDYPHKILIVDDDDMHRQIMSIQLGKLGYHADQAADGEQAVAAVMGNEYDLIFMDLRMPNMSGIEASLWIRERFSRNHGVRIVALTGDATLEAQQQSIHAGMDSFVTKPARTEDIQSILSFTNLDEGKMVASLH